MTSRVTFGALLAFLAVVALAAFGQQPVEYRGTLDRMLVAHTPPWYVLSQAKPATDAERARIAIPVAADATISVAEVGLLKDGKFRAAFIQSASAERTVLVDLDRDGAWSDQERRPLLACADPVDGAGAVEATFDVPLPDGYAFKSYPLKILLDPDEGPGDGSRTMLAQSSGVAVQGVVDIGGRRTLVRYTGVNLRTGAIDFTSRNVEIDVNGDGVINTAWDSPEVSAANGEAAVWKVGTHHVSTTQVDAVAGTFVMRDRPASDYTRIELTAGAPVADFAFVDFDGKPRKLSDYRGTFLLLDFWGTWCGPCVAEFPNLKKAYDTYRAKGLEILGMDREEWEGTAVAPVLEKARALVAEKGVTWPQARADSIKPTIERFHIVPYPTYVLLDREGRIVSWGGKGQLPLRGPDLMTTLEKVLRQGR